MFSCARYLPWLPGCLRLLRIPRYLRRGSARPFLVSRFGGMMRLPRPHRPQNSASADATPSQKRPALLRQRRVQSAPGTVVATQPRWANHPGAHVSGEGPYLRFVHGRTGGGAVLSFARGPSVDVTGHIMATYLLRKPWRVSGLWWKSPRRG